MILTRGIAVAVAIIVACLIVLGLASSFLVDWAWFSSVGYLAVFWTILSVKSALFSAVFVASAVPIWLSGALAVRFAAPRASRRAANMPWESLGSAYRRLVKEHRIEGATLILRTGKTDFTGASVAHLHAQLISGSRREADSELIRALVGFKEKR